MFFHALGPGGVSHSRALKRKTRTYKGSVSRLHSFLVSRKISDNSNSTRETHTLLERDNNTCLEPMRLWGLRRAREAASRRHSSILKCCLSFQGLSGGQAGAQGANGSEDTGEPPCATNSFVLVHMHESWGQRA